MCVCVCVFVCVRVRACRHACVLVCFCSLHSKHFIVSCLHHAPYVHIITLYVPLCVLYVGGES